MDVKIQKIYFESIQFFHINSFHTNMYVAIAIGTVSFCKSHVGGNIVCVEVTIFYYTPLLYFRLPRGSENDEVLLGAITSNFGGFIASN